MKIRDIIFVLVILPLCSCAKDILDLKQDESEAGEARIIVVESIEKTADKLENYCTFEGVTYVAQGTAICGNILYRLYDTGLCQTYSIEDISNPRKLATFELGSRKDLNHCNCAQIMLPDNGDTLLYVGGLRGKCFVERISTDHSELVQTITLPQLGIFHNTQNMNMICGDDGFLWLFGEARATQTLFFAKARLPLISEGDVVLSQADIIDYWHESGYVYNESVWQGGMVYEGNLFYVFGRGESNRHIAVYNTYNHTKVEDINLNGIVTEEPEDCDMHGGYIVLSVYGGKGYYLLKLM